MPTMRGGPVDRHASVTPLDGRRSYDAPVSDAPVYLPVAGPGAGQTVLPLSPTGRRTRLAATAVVLALVFGGSVQGDDSWFPVGPFSMYSGRADPDGQVNSTRVVGLTAAGEEVRLSGGAVGLRRAEFEGQLPRLQEQPELLALLADSYAAQHPDEAPLVRVQVVQRRTQLVDGEPTGTTDTVLVDHDLGGTP